MVDFLCSLFNLKPEQLVQYSFWLECCLFFGLFLAFRKDKPITLWDNFLCNLGLFCYVAFIVGIFVVGWIGICVYPNPPSGGYVSTF